MQLSRQRSHSFAQIAFAPLGVLLAHFSLIRQLTLRALAGRYRGSLLGIVWSVLHPLALLAAYTFVFHVVLDARWEQLPLDRTNANPQAAAFDFAIPLFSGLIVFWWVAECLQLSPMLVQHHSNYVKKTIFPLPALPYPALLVASIHALISSGVLCLYLLVTQQLASSAWAYPLVLLSLAPYLLAAMWLLGSIGVYFKDLTHLVTLAVMMLMFLTPVFYPLSAVPESWHFWLHLNPLTFTTEQARTALLWGTGLDWLGLAQFFGLGWLLASLSYFIFTHLQKDFADVL